jgi:two-component system chemotaxis response regulator CheY
VTTQRSILIVDDEFGLAEMLRDMLRELDYDVTLAINGRLALDILGEKQVDLVITDMMMPVMDGFELATAMRQSRAHRAIPIMMMTSLPTTPHANGLFDAVIRKPFTPELLLTTMQTCFTKSSNPTADRRDGTSS